MRYIPNSRARRSEMLESVGIGREEDLFEVIPEEYRLQDLLNIPGPLDEPSLLKHMSLLASENRGADRKVCILGGGAYHHYIPAVVDHVISRSEFYTAYTPYQPEISQGTLQAIFEYQSLVCALTGMDVSNASLYDGASAAAEAVLMARRVTRKNRIILSRAVNPVYREVVRTYLENQDVEILEVDCGPDGRTDYQKLSDMLDGETACFLVQSPNFFGVIEDYGRLKEIRESTEAHLAAVVSEPVSLGLLAPPGDWGADSVAAEGQSFGNPLGYGGPYLGILAAREASLRQMPGRLVGETVDVRGNRGFVLTLSTREQHIRRERATSNVCSNQGLCALAAAVHLNVLGPEGLRRAAAENVLRTARAREGLAGMKGWTIPFDAPVFNEFVALPGDGAREVQASLREAGFTGGLEIGKWYPELEGAILFCFTEMVSGDEVERFLEAAGGRS